MIGTHGLPQNTHVTLTKAEACSYMTHIRRSDVYGGMYKYLYVCVKYFFFNNLVVDDIQ